MSGPMTESVCNKSIVIFVGFFFKYMNVTLLNQRDNSASPAEMMFQRLPAQEIH